MVTFIYPPENNHYKLTTSSKQRRNVKELLLRSVGDLDVKINYSTFEHFCERAFNTNITGFPPSTMRQSSSPAQRGMEWEAAVGDTKSDCYSGGALHITTLILNI